MGKKKKMNKDQRDPRIKNIVATVNLDLLAKKCKNTEYTQERFTAVTMRLNETSTKARIFKSGKILIMGAVSIDDCKVAARKFAKLVRQSGAAYGNVRFKEFKVRNVVGVADMMFPIRLEALQLSHEKFCQYEPEIFPAAIYKLLKPR